MSKNFNHDDFLFRILFLGDSTVGKSSLFNKLTTDDYYLEPSIPTTIGVDFKIKSFDNFLYQNKNYAVKLQLWDMAGQKRFSSIVQSYLKMANACIFMYDITNRESFENVENWYNDVVSQKYSIEDISFILIGNKTDLEKNRTVLYKEGKELADRLNLDFYEISVRDTDKIITNKILKTCVTKLIKSNIEKLIYRDSTKLISNADTSDKKLLCDKCCTIC